MPQKNKRHHPSSPTASSATSKRPRAEPNPSTHVQLKPSAAPPEAAAPEYHASHTIHVVASSKIQAKVRAVLTALSSNPSPEADNVVVLLQARAPAANKLISVAEIAKRELEHERRSWWSYVGVKGLLVELGSKDNRKPSKQGGSDASQDAEQDESSDAEDDAFEPLPGQRDQKKVRNVPVMNLYLATKPIPALRTPYGEQHSED
ncbi:uncharacterized protein J3D65DRAFT_613055 [Phyllosticta citribraziliensis]|uniref:DNA/RNA-binding protein Alba-like domain-containing protein n=1 Tax=Phyllosticta citribraziliensis TaxID=989973 RepID=A0ABR1M3R4_9PEZI